MSERPSLATRAVHGVRLPPPDEQPVAPPLYQTATFAFDDAAHFAETLHQPGKGYVYSRYENPTTAMLEATVADLEGAQSGLAFASGMAAISTTLLALAGAGDHVVAGAALYGGTYSLLHEVAPRLGIETTFVDFADLDAVRHALRPQTRVVYAETIVNPTMTVHDLPALAEIAHEAGASFVVDNTVATPLLCRPLAYGADVVVHSATKYLGGHSDVVSGIALFADPGTRLRAWHLMIDLGGSADPFAAWLVLRGLKTLPLRMARHSANAREVAEYLQRDERVRAVYWPGLERHPSHLLAAKLLDDYSGFLSFEVEGGREAGQRVTERVRIARMAASLGGPETLLAHPASTTHRQYSEEALARAGIAPGLVRMSVGLEDAVDLIADLDGALAR